MREEKVAEVLNHINHIIAEEMRTDFESLLIEAEVKEALRTALNRKALGANDIPWKL